MADDPELRRWLILAAANLPVYLALGKFFFGNWGGFFEALRFWLMPDLISLFRGEFSQDVWAEFKLFIFLALCALVVYGEHRYFFPG